MRYALAKKIVLAAIISALAASCLIIAAAADKTPVEVLYISDKYVFPMEISRPHGQFLIVIKNQSSLIGLVLHLKKSDSEADVALADMDEEDGKYEALLDLDPGTYKLFEPTHSELICTLTITR